MAPFFSVSQIVTGECTDGIVEIRAPGMVEKEKARPEPGFW